MGIAPAQQLAGEWVDIENVGDESFSFEDTKLQHVAYSPAYPNGVWTDVMSFKGSLKTREIMRVHSGLLTPLLPIDSQGADYHLFSGKNYVWNNDVKDTTRLINKVSGVEVDKAGYVSPPPDGKILKRSGNYLV